MKCLRMIIWVPALLSLYACAMVDSAARELTTGAESDVPKVYNVPKVYYVGVSGLKMFSECGRSGSLIAELPLNEKVLRYKLERGFAYIKVAGSGQTGWVRNAKLVWRKPSPKKAAPERHSGEEKPKVDREPPPVVNPEFNPETERRDASMFDAF